MAILDSEGSRSSGGASRAMPEPHCGARVAALSSLLPHVRAGDRVLDVGAGDGWSTLQLARAVGPDGQVWAVEPDAEHRALLRHHLMKAGLEARVTVLAVALGEEAGEADPLAGTDHPLSDPVPVQTLDALVAAGVLACPDIVHLDVAGQEGGVLRGGRDVLVLGRPMVGLGWTEAGAGGVGSCVEEMLNTLYDFGYAPVSPDGRRSIHGVDELLGGREDGEPVTDGSAGELLAFPLESLASAGG